MKAQKTMSTPVFFAILAALYICLLLVSCRSAKSSRTTTDAINENTIDSSSIYREQWQNELQYTHQLEQRIREYEIAGIVFQPCPDSSGKVIPNTVDIGSDGSVHATGNIQSASISKKKFVELQQQLALAQQQSMKKEVWHIYITKTIKNWHSETIIKKSRFPWWVFVLIGMGVMGVICRYWKWIRAKLEVFSPFFYLPQKR